MELAMAIPAILLCVTEQADLKTIVALMCTSKTNHQLITSYEHSICKEKYRQLDLQPIGGFLLSTGDENRYVVPGHTFRAVAELNQREARIDHLLNCDFVIPTDPSELSLTPEQHARLRAGLKRAMSITDYLADLAATLAAADPNIIIPSTTITPLPFPSTLSFPSAYPDIAINPSTMPPYAAMIPTSNLVATVLEVPSFRRFRGAQLAHLDTLSTTDLALLKTFSDFAGSAYTRHMGSKLLSDDRWPERKLAFSECALRRGSRVLWGLHNADGEEHGDVMAGAREVFEELRLFEQGGDMQPGLNMTIFSLMRGRLIYGGRDEFDEYNWNREEVRKTANLGAEIEKVVDAYLGKETAEDDEATEIEAIVELQDENVEISDRVEDESGKAETQSITGN